MRFRTAESSDLDALLAFYGDIADVMVGTPFDCLWRRGAHPDEETLSEAIAAGQLTIADDEGTIAAAVVVNRDFDESTAPDLPWTVSCPLEEAAVIHVFAAAPEYRRTGIARALLLHVIDTSRAQGIRSLRLGAASNNTPAVKLYERCGFQPIIEAKRSFGGALVDAITLELPL